MLRSRIKISKINSTLIRNITSATRSRLVQASEVHRSISTVPISQSTTSGSRIQSRKWNGLHSLNNSRFIHSSCSSKQRDSTTGGIPNDGSHPTVYDDFFNLLEGGLPQAVEVKSMSSTSFTLTDGLVISQPCIFLNGAVFLWDPPHLDRLKATPGGNGWEEWNQDVWTLFEISSPKPEILIFGTGKTVLPPPAKVKNHLNSLGIQVDVQDSRNACSTFNLLSEEGRRVAVALLPSERSPTKKVLSKE